jgi:hypothetical protein
VSRASDIRQGAFGRASGVRIEIRIMAIVGGAVRTDDFVLIAHVEIHMRMIEGRLGPDAHEFMGADFNDRDAGVIVKVRDDVLRHVVGLASGEELLRRTIAKRFGDS